MAVSNDLQSHLDRLLTGKPHRPGAVQPLTPLKPGNGTASRTFSAFRLSDLYRANQFAAQWMALAQSVRADTGDAEAGARAVLNAAEKALAAENADMVRFALKTFITHHRHGTGLRILPIERRHPHKVLPSVEEGGSPSANPEVALAWWREDPKLAEHHEHWHVVYDIAGIPGPNMPTNGEIKDRQGELFFYMHRQMLARYDAERLALGIERVKPWAGIDEIDEDGYDPGPYLRPYYSPREPGQKMQDIAEGCADDYAHSVSRFAEQWQRMRQAVADGHFIVSDDAGGRRTIPLDINSLGATVEADIGSVEMIRFNDSGVSEMDAVLKFLGGLSQGTYGNIHNDGHDYFASMSTDPCNLPGVMDDTSTAVRDPIFYRWHRHIDTLGFDWENKQPSNDFSDAPPVLLRNALPHSADRGGQSPDIILAFRADIPVEWADDLDGYGELMFGGDNWDRDFSTGEATTGELMTRMLRRTITIEPGRESGGRAEQAHTISYLDQDEFVYFIRIENLAAEAQDVTLRIFLAPLTEVDDRRMWIEMDKFRCALPGAARTVIARPAWLSSVIRKPGLKPPDADTPADQGSPGGVEVNAEQEDNYCDCGWPYNLLLPRGTRAGMPFRLMVMATDWELDQVEQDSCCGSMSYCGAKDKYPDARAMGYPFDRPFAPGRGIDATIESQPNMAARDIIIRWVKDS